MDIGSLLSQLACVFMSADMCMCMYGYVPNACMAGSFQDVLLPLLQQVSDHCTCSNNETPRIPLKMTNVQLYNYKDTQQACNC